MNRDDSVPSSHSLNLRLNTCFLLAMVEYPRHIAQFRELGPEIVGLPSDAPLHDAAMLPVKLVLVIPDSVC